MSDEKKRVAILAADGVEQSELFDPMEALQDAGYGVDVISIKGGDIVGWDETDWDEDMPVQSLVSEAAVDDYVALIIPGGRISPDLLREDEDAVKFVRDFHDSGKLIASICHGPWVLIEADVVRGIRLTSYGSIKTDLINAGAKWVDDRVVVDNNIVTSRSPEDLSDFIDTILKELNEQEDSN